MIALVVVLVLVIVGLVVWDRTLREPPAADPPHRTIHPAQRQAPQPAGPTGRPRFQGRGVVARDVVTARPVNRPGPQAGIRFVSRATATPRFSGEVRRSPDAIGLACGRPIAECDRGADCVCVD